jgi:hypothetical protein
MARRLLAALPVLALVLVLSPAGASADTTHVFQKYITLAGAGDVQPEGVDAQGNLIVWDNAHHAVEKYDIDGNPVPFSALGTNAIDGAGNHECPTVPADCDQVPTTNGFATTTQMTGPVTNVVAIDHSGGPADGYIYVLNNFVTQAGLTEGEVDVFDASGAYKGMLDESQVFPDRRGMEEAFGFSHLGSISVASNGVVYVVVPQLTLAHVDRYVPIDGNPEHHQFSGQIRAACPNSICVSSLASFVGGAGGLNYYYASGIDETHAGGDSSRSSFYARFPMPEFQRVGERNFAVSDSFSPDVGPFGNGGFYPPFNSNLSTIAIDPADQHVYIGTGGAGIQEWTEDNRQVGPVFATDHAGSPMDTIAFGSGGPNAGDIYVRGAAANQVAVFGPPVTIPDIKIEGVTAGHSTAHLTATVETAGGLPVTDCRIEYGFLEPSFNAPYPNSMPCEPSTTFDSDTQITADFSGLTPETDYHYRIVAANTNGVNKTRDQVFHTVAVLGAHIDPAGNLTPTSAELNGSLDPDGIDTTYHFEYGISTQYNNRTPERDAGAGSGEQSLPPEPISGLQAGRTYHFRLVARNVLGRTKSQDGTFTAPGRPRVSGVRAVNVAAGSAELNARIDPLGFDTTYHFEYGLSPSYGLRTPDVEMGAQQESVLVGAPIEGLPSGVTHFRVVAENQWGTTTSPDTAFSFFAPSCPNSHVRQQVNANSLPDCRAYELVSPASAGNVALFPGEISVRTSGGFTLRNDLRFTAPNAEGLATAPSRFGFMGGQGAVDGLNPPNSFMDRYVSTRTTNGWVTTYPGRAGNEALVSGRPLCNSSMDTCIDYRVEGVFGGGTKSNAPYVWDTDGNSLGRWPTNLRFVPGADQAVVDGNPSADFSHYVFTSVSAAFAPGGLEAPPGTVYDNNIGEKTVTIASLGPDGTPIPQADAPGADPNRKTEIAAISSDGSHILMAATTNPACEGVFTKCPSKLSFPAHLYMRVDEAVTYEISPSANAVFAGMTSNGSQVMFTSEDRLSPQDTDNSVDLYRWTEATESIALLSQGNGAGDADDCAAQWDSGCDVRLITTERPDTDDTIASANGDIYFYSPEQLDPNDSGVKNERNLYVYRQGAVHYVTTFDPGTQADRMQISPDGSHMAFLSRTRATAYDNTQLNDQGEPTQWQEMYEYDPSTGDVVCASCIPSGGPPSIFSAALGGTTKASSYDVKASQSGRFMSDDGRVAFATADALVAADTNGKIDVYEFVDNRAQLITRGSGDRDTQGGVVFYPTLHTGLEAISRNGVDLYFSTFETLVPEDRNGSFVKFYDARSNGGFPFPNALLPCTAADECHGDTSLAPPQVPIGTAGDLGSTGGVKKAKQPKRKGTKKKKKKAKKRRHHRHHRKGARSHG